MIFGAPFADTTAGADSGQAYVIFGAAGGPGDINVTTMPTQGFDFRHRNGGPGGRRGRSAGDFNGDGIDDIIVGAREADPLGRITAGEAISSTASWRARRHRPRRLDADRGFRIAGAGDRDYLGDAASSAGDINGDGFDES